MPHRSDFWTVLFTALLLSVPGLATAQHPTAVTSIVNSDADTTMEVNYNGSLLMSGTYNPTAPNDSIPAEGAGNRLMWYPAKAAFRAGQVGGTQWDAANVGLHSVAFGVDTRAIGDNATAIGKKTSAATDGSLSIGVNNGANGTADNTLFVAGNGGTDFKRDALVLKKDGDLGIMGAFRADLAGGNYAGHFLGSKSGSANAPSDHIAFVENTGGTDSDGLAIQAGPTSSPGNAVNYITFYDGDGDAIGTIEGDGSGGVTQTSGSGDFAEELPVAEGTESPEPAEIVGVEGGTVSLSTGGADRVMVASRAPILTGNATPDTEADNNERVAVAFVGQVPVKLRGTAQPGDLIVPSGKEDGTARAVSPKEYRRSKHGPIAGQAWSSKSADGVGEVTVAVGLGSGDVLARKLAEERRQKDRQEKRLTELEKRLAKLEAKEQTALAGLPGPWSLLLALGAFGAGLLWRRRA